MVGFFAAPPPFGGGGRLKQFHDLFETDAARAFNQYEGIAHGMLREIGGQLVARGEAEDARRTRLFRRGEWRSGGGCRTGCVRRRGAGMVLPEE